MICVKNSKVILNLHSSINSLLEPNKLLDLSIINSVLYHTNIISEVPCKEDEIINMFYDEIIDFIPVVKNNIDVLMEKIENNIKNCYTFSQTKHEKLRELNTYLDSAFEKVFLNNIKFNIIIKNVYSLNKLKKCVDSIYNQSYIKYDISYYNDNNINDTDMLQYIKKENIQTIYNMHEVYKDTKAECDWVLVLDNSMFFDSNSLCMIYSSISSNDKLLV